MKNKLIHRILQTFCEKVLGWLIPDHRIGTTFKHEGSKYLTVISPNKEYPGCVKSYHNKNSEPYCSFCDNCEEVSIFKKGYCSKPDRSDNTYVAFLKVD